MKKNQHSRHNSSEKESNDCRQQTNHRIVVLSDFLEAKIIILQLLVYYIFSIILFKKYLNLF